jgi:CheY-like chemotaxis protein
MRHSKVLRGWKDISAYLGTSVSTAQRWEATMGLPVHRRGTPGSSIFCLPDEIDSWLLQTSARAKPRVRSTFLLIDLAAEGPSSNRLSFDETKYNVLFAFSGSEAISIAQRKYVDGFIFAVHLDALQDLELCQLLARNYPSRPIALVAGKFMRDPSTEITVGDALHSGERCRITISVPVS